MNVLAPYLASEHRRKAMALNIRPFKLFNKLFVKNPETQKFYYETHKGSDKLLIFFSSAAATELEGFRRLSSFKVNKIFVRDDSRGWYNGEIADLSRDADDLLRKLKLITRRYDRRNITVSGSSMGGYAALLFGCLLECGRVVAIAPQTKLRPGIPYSPKIEVKYDNLLDVMRENKETQIDVWFGTEGVADLYHCLECGRIDNVRMFPVKGSMHDIMPPLKSMGVIDRFFDYVVTGSDFQFDGAIDVGFVDPTIINRAMISYYVDGRYQETIDVLLPVSAEYNLSAVNFLIGLAHSKLRADEVAIDYLTKAIQISECNYDAHYNLGIVNFRQRRLVEAEQSFKAAIHYRPTSFALYHYRLGATQKHLRKNDEAIKSLSEALSLDPEMHIAHKHLSDIYRKLMEMDLVEHHRLQYEARDPKSVKADT